MNPWMSKEEIETIKKYLNSDMIMLEYGCGGSTLFFPQFVKEYYSIEHDREWFEKIKKQIANHTYMYYVGRNSTTPDHERIVAKSVAELENSSRAKDFTAYIRYPEKLNIKFDAVLIDGRARPECAAFIRSFLKDGGYLFIHDYWARKPYHVVSEIYDLIDSVKTGQSIAIFKK